MGRLPLAESKKLQILELYRKDVTLQAISNLLGVGYQTVANVVQEYVKLGAIKPRYSHFGKTRAPNGQGREKYVKKGYHPKKKLNDEQESELLKDYFVNNMTYSQIMQKYGLWQGSIKIIVDRAIRQGLYQPKGKGYKKPKLKENDIV